MMASFKFKMLKKHQKIFPNLDLYLILIVAFVLVSSCKSNQVMSATFNNQQVDANKWIPIKDFKSSASDFMKVSESISTPISSTDNNRQHHLLHNSKQQDPHQHHPNHQQINHYLQNFNSILPMCARLSANQLLELLNIQKQQQQQPQVQAHQQQEASFLTPVSVANQVIRNSRGLIDSLSESVNAAADAGDDEDDYNDDGDQGENNSENNSTPTALKPASNNSLDSWPISTKQLNNQQSVKLNNHQINNIDNKQQLLEDEQLEEALQDSLRKEQEAGESSEAEAADKSALDEQQQQQKEIIQAQAESEAKAIKEQQESLLKQQKLQQSMLFLRDRNSANNNNDDLLANFSNSHHVGSLVDYRKLQKLSPQLPLSADIQFSDQPDSSIHHKQLINNNNDNLLKELDSKTVQLIKTSDLIPAAQHHYGSHYGSLHGHQSHYYQYAESHKKGQYDSGFKRGNKKFKISGHSSQHKSHADGHVKWKAKKGKGSHYWDLKHKGKKHHYHHYH